MRTLLLAAAALAAVAVATPAGATCVGSVHGRVCSTVGVSESSPFATCVETPGGCVPVPGPSGCIAAGGTTWTAFPICLS